jgi:flagellar biosynthesis/type III secretory pathway chaperone
MVDSMTQGDIFFVENLKQLENVLDCEYQALLSGDAKTVSALAAEKERIADDLKAAQSDLDQKTKMSADILLLAARVDELAKLNHMLLKQMYQHYHGMLELFMRLGGKSRTYGKNGIVTVESPSDKGGEILA